VLSLRIFFLGFESNTELISIVILVTQIISFVFATGYVLSNLFMSKENVLLMVLPVSPNEIFISKIVLLYVQELIINTLYTLPLLVIVGLSSPGLSLSYYYLMPALLILLPVLPLALASIVAVPLMFLIRFLKKHLILWSLLILGCFAYGFTIYMKAVKAVTLVFNSRSRQIEEILKVNEKVLQFGQKNFLYFHVTEGLITAERVYWLGLFLVLSITVLEAGILVVKPLYFRMTMSSLEESTGKQPKKKTYTVYSPFVSLLIKEIKTVFRSPNYLFQYFLYVLLMPVIVIAYDQLLIPFTRNEAGMSMVIGAHILIVAMMAMLANIVSASAITREGGCFYLMKVSPTDYYLQTFAKLVFNMLFSITAIIVTGILSARFIEWKYVLLITPAVIFSSMGHLFLSYEWDLKKPVLDWYDSEEISKIDGTTSKSIICGLIISLVLGFMTFTTGNIVKPLIQILFLSFVFCIIRLYFLILRVAYCYDRIEV
jgi:ABC-2 type transport system permease protein